MHLQLYKITDTDSFHAFFPKLVFVSNDEKTEMIFQSNHSAWSRGAMTFFIDDLSKGQARHSRLAIVLKICWLPFFSKRKVIVSFCRTNFSRQNKCQRLQRFLQAVEFLLQEDEILQKGSVVTGKMPPEHVEKVIDLVGGRLQLLLVCKQGWMEGKTFKETAQHLKLKERVKFRDIAGDEMMGKVIETVRAAPNRRILLSKLDMLTSREVVNELARRNIIKIVQDENSRFVVQIQSRLTEQVIDDLAVQRAANLKATGLAEKVGFR